MNKAFRNILLTLLRLSIATFAATLLTFVLITSAPIDPVSSYLGDKSVSKEQRENIEKQWGLDKPPAERYIIWLGNLFNGDLGQSFSYRQPVKEVLGARFQSSIILLLCAWLISGLIGFTLGIVCGIFQNSLIDRIIKNLSIAINSTPLFWIGMIMLMFFSLTLKWFPMGFAAPVGVTSNEVTFLDRLHHLVLPALTLSITGTSAITLHTRQKLIDILHSDFVLYAQAKGLSQTKIILKHCIRNISIPALTLQFASFGELFGGSVLAEQVFSYPGIGSVITSAGKSGDVPLLLGAAMFTTVFVFVGNMTANVIYSLLDPRMREAGYAK